MRIRWRREPSTSAVTAGCALVEETEAFLSGTYASCLRSRGKKVSGWARLNSFAHGDLEQLLEVHRLLTSRFPVVGMDCHQQAWVNANRILARDILRIVGRDDELLSILQRAILVPLELQLIRLEAERGLTEYELVDSVRVALRSYSS
jgi:hypothetical protein